MDKLNGIFLRKLRKSPYKLNEKGINKTKDVIDIPVYCYFNGIPNKDTLLGLALGNCEVAKYVYKEKEIDER